MVEGTAQRLDELLNDVALAGWRTGGRGIPAADEIRALVRGQADALQAATDERDEAQSEVRALMHTCRSFESDLANSRRRKDEAEAALQRVREVVDERAHTTVGAVKADVRAALGVGVPTCNHPEHITSPSGRRLGWCEAEDLHGWVRCDVAGPLLPVPENPTTETDDPLDVCDRCAFYRKYHDATTHAFVGPVTPEDPKEQQQ